MDTTILFWINSHHTPFLDNLLRWTSAVTELYLLWWVSGALAWVGDKQKGGKVALAVLLSLVLAYLCVDILIKPLIARPRPFVSFPDLRQLPPSFLAKIAKSPYSFPSGHCASSAAAALTLALSYKRLRLPLAIAVFLVAYSRVYLAMHYPSDCAAGVIIGAACALMTRRIIRA